MYSIIHFPEMARKAVPVNNSSNKLFHNRFKIESKLSERGLQILILAKALLKSTKDFKYLEKIFG